MNAYMTGYKAGERVARTEKARAVDVAIGIGFCIGCFVGGIAVVVYGPLIFRWLA